MRNQNDCFRTASEGTVEDCLFKNSVRQRVKIKKKTFLKASVPYIILDELEQMINFRRKSYFLPGRFSFDIILIVTLFV